MKRKFYYVIFTIMCPLIVLQTLGGCAREKDDNHSTEESVILTQLMDFNESISPKINTPKTKSIGAYLHVAFADASGAYSGFKVGAWVGTKVGALFGNPAAGATIGGISTGIIIGAVESYYAWPSCEDVPDYDTEINVPDYDTAINLYNHINAMYGHLWITSGSNQGSNNDTTPNANDGNKPDFPEDYEFPVDEEGDEYPDDEGGEGFIDDDGNFYPVDDCEEINSAVHALDNNTILSANLSEAGIRGGLYHNLLLASLQGELYIKSIATVGTKAITDSSDMIDDIDNNGLENNEIDLEACILTSSEMKDAYNNYSFGNFELGYSLPDKIFNLYSQLFNAYPENIDDVVYIANQYLRRIKTSNELTNDEKIAIEIGIAVSIYSYNYWFSQSHSEEAEEA